MDICRPIILYGDYVPPNPNEHIWTYRTFGYYDGVTVDSKIEIKDTKDLIDIWYHSVEFSKKLNGEYSYQTIYAVRTENNEKCIRDEEFWSESESENDMFPFVFFSILQFCEKYDSLKKQYKLLEKKLNTDKTKAILYYTLGGSDILLVLRCKEYSIGANIIHSFHCADNELHLYNECKAAQLQYSFTIAGYQRTKLNSLNELCGEEKVENATIHLIEKRPGSNQEIIRNITKEIQKVQSAKVENYSVMGADDNILIISNFPWKNFLKFYADNPKSFFSNCSEYQGKNFLGVTSIIASKTNLKEITVFNKAEGKYSSNNTVRPDIFNHIRQIYSGEVCKCEKNLEEKMYEKYMMELLNTLQKIENAPVNDYIFFQMIEPIKMFAEYMRDIYLKKINLIPDIYDDMYDFFQAINNISQNSFKNDRQMTQNIDLNLRIYNAPMKLAAFYSACISIIKDYLNKKQSTDEKEHYYEFLVCPGSLRMVRVQELFREISTTNRLFVVEIPEYQLYNVKSLLFALIHELGHFVGSSIRMRKLRREIVIEMMCRMTAILLVSRVNTHIGGTMNKLDEEYINILYEEFIEKIVQFKNNTNEKEQYHFNKMEKDIQRAIGNMLKGMQDDIIKPIVYKYKISVLTKLLENKDLDADQIDAEAERQSERMKKILEDELRGLYIYNTNSISVFDIMGFTRFILKECLADLSVIMITECEFKDYVETIMLNTDSIKDDVKETQFVVRVGLVLYCMYHKTEQGFSWNRKKDIEWYNGLSDGSQKSTVHSFLSFEQHISKEKKFDFGEPIYSKDIDNITLLGEDLEVNKIALKYLMSCKQKFIEWDEKNRHNEIRELLKIYFKTNEMEYTIEDIISYFQDTIDKHKNMIMKKYGGRKDDIGDEVYK